MKNVCMFVVLAVSAGTFVVLLTGCAEESYNQYGYNSGSSYDKRMDNEAQKDMNDASKMLSAQDIKNIQNMK
ncbi:hypothetical protein [Sulfurovum sp.]|uniref:hypothetical protein n=1 Tax=Sulfurovum sp. TaxID=1969726 RepID=UPI00263464B7|nr:hypothetical protein [Sulfurovum sp.]